jgi:hypothetical protein
MRSSVHFDPARRLLVQVCYTSKSTCDIRLFRLDSIRPAYVRASFLELTDHAGAPLSVHSKRLARVTDALGVPLNLIWRILIKKLLIADRMGRIISFRTPASADLFAEAEIKRHGIDGVKLARMVPLKILHALFHPDHPFARWYWCRLMDGF